MLILNMFEAIETAVYTLFVAKVNLIRENAFRRNKYASI